MSMADTFESWWYHTGSGITPLPDTDLETHTREVSRRAFEAGRQAAIEEAREALEREAA